MSKANLKSVKLQNPIVRGETKITEVTLREPKSGELRGLSMIELIQLQFEAVATLLPRISNPPLIEDEVSDLAPADFLKLSTEVADFLLPQEAKQASPPA